jgi:GntR family transcriptional regulator of vanillate catabolism
LTAEARSPQQLKALLKLRELLVSGAFRAGERVSELPLVARLGVSRTPARLALLTLEHEGLLRMLPTGGFVVRDFLLADIADAIELRGVLEGTAARLAAERGAAAVPLARMRGAVAGIDGWLTEGEHGIADFAGYVALNEDFHAALLDLADSAMLRRAMEQVSALPFASASASARAPSRLMIASSIP